MEEFVADVVDTHQGPPSRDDHDMDRAVDDLIAHTRRRVKDLVAAGDGRPALMLSGGIDSIFVASIAADTGVDPRCVTVTYGEQPESRQARQATAALGLNLVHSQLDLPTLAVSASVVSQSLSSSEPWEVAAGVIVCESLRAIRGLDTKGTVLTGTGADVALAGGLLPVDPFDAVHSQLVTDRIWSDVQTKWTKSRPTPNFHELLVRAAEAARLSKTFQTVEFWDLSKRWSTKVLYVRDADGQIHDKAVLRLAARKIGVPDELVWAPKDPMQTSSGVFAGLADVCRALLAQESHAEHYTKLATEPVDVTLSRAALTLLRAAL